MLTCTCFAGGVFSRSSTEAAASMDAAAAAAGILHAAAETTQSMKEGKSKGGQSKKRCLFANGMNAAAAAEDGPPAKFDSAEREAKTKMRAALQNKSLSRYYDPLVRAGVRNLLDLKELKLEDLEGVDLLKDEPALQKTLFLRHVARADLGGDLKRIRLDGDATEPSFRIVDDNQPNADAKPESANDLRPKMEADIAPPDHSGSRMPEKVAASKPVDDQPAVEHTISTGSTAGDASPKGQKHVPAQGSSSVGAQQRSVPPACN